MIKTRQILRAERASSCDNCNREMPLVIEYTFSNAKGKEYNKIILCEDCANAMSTLFYKTMEEGKSFKYELDEFKEV